MFLLGMTSTVILTVKLKKFESKLTSTVSKMPVHAKDSELCLSAKDLLTVLLCSPKELKGNACKCISIA